MRARLAVKREKKKTSHRSYSDWWCCHLHYTRGGSSCIITSSEALVHPAIDMVLLLPSICQHQGPAKHVKALVWCDFPMRLMHAQAQLEDDGTIPTDIH